MNFEKNEIIVLSGGKKYVIADITSYEEKNYYYVREITPDEKKVTNNYKVITTVKENGYLFVKTIKGTLYDELMEIFNK